MVLTNTLPTVSLVYLCNYHICNTTIEMTIHEAQMKRQWMPLTPSIEPETSSIYGT